MATYLLTHNPKKWIWTNIKDDIAEIKKDGYSDGRWSTGATKKIVPGDRVFLIRLGIKPLGIIGSGWAISEVFQDIHWNDNSKLALYVEVRFDVILDFDTQPIFPIDIRNGIYQKMDWTPQASGVRIPDDIAFQLEEDWAKFLSGLIPSKDLEYPDEIEIERSYPEGVRKQVVVNMYERNPAARAICLKEYGFTCSVCGFDFSSTYGDIGKNYIHVHHLKPLSEVGVPYQLNPIEDLRPICPNCHAMLHQRKPAYSINELKMIMEGISKENSVE